MIQLNFTPYTIPAIISTALGIFSTGILWRRRHSQGAFPLALLFISITIWSFSYTFLVSTVQLSSKIIWLKLEYLGIIPSTLIWLVFCLNYTNNKTPKNQSYLLVLALIPIITLILTWTNELHNLMWREIKVAPGQWGFLDFQNGPWFWVHFGYSFLLLLAGIYILVKKNFSLPKEMRQDIQFVIVAGIIPGIAEILHFIGVDEFLVVDLTSLGFTLTGIILLYGYYFQQFMDIGPIARETTIENLVDGIIVIDLHGRIVDINPAAEEIIKLHHVDVIGRSYSDVLSDLNDWIDMAKENQTSEKIMVIEGEEEEQQFFNLSFIPLTDSRGKSVGFTIIFHDNTESHYLNKSLKDQTDRLAVLYEIGKAISSTLKIDALLELIYTQLSKVIQCEAYFVALYLPETHELDIRILYDEGKRFPPAKVDASKGLSSWVVENKKPLLIQDLRKEMEYLPVKPILVGEKRLSRSWLGIPLITENNLIGLLAVASYKPNMFNNNDKLLMEQIGQQAALSIQNAHHYEEVTRQANLDSLTGVSNHNHFIEILYKEGQEALAAKSPLSLIMLDIDHFKLYNDTYGHTIGDQVLRLTVQAIKSHIKNTDTVGRWGGEEFGIVLPNATTSQANMVANRIRRTLSELPLFNVEGNTIPKPTISQGIATSPDHTSDVDELVVIADRALYRAKARGRDQVAVGKPSEPADSSDSNSD